MKRLLILIDLLILTTGCSSIHVNQPSHKTYIQMMMRSAKCTNACWLGIEAGMNLEAKDTFVILGNYYGNENVYYPDYSNIESSVGWITWDEDVSPLFLEKGFINFTNGKQVNTITIIFQNDQISVSDLVLAFGKPELTTIVNPDAETKIGIPCSLRRLLYPKIGLGVIVEGTIETSYVAMMYISKPYTVNQDNFSGMSAEKETSIKWDDRNKYCLNATP
jgi:hypothetical protein